MLGSLLIAAQVAAPVQQQVAATIQPYVADLEALASSTATFRIAYLGGRFSQLSEPEARRHKDPKLRAIARALLWQRPGVERGVQVATFSAGRIIGFGYRDHGPRRGLGAFYWNGKRGFYVDYKASRIIVVRRVVVGPFNFWPERFLGFYGTRPIAAMLSDAAVRGKCHLRKVADGNVAIRHENVINGRKQVMEQVFRSGKKPMWLAWRVLQRNRVAFERRFQAWQEDAGVRWPATVLEATHSGVVQQLYHVKRVAKTIRPSDLLRGGPPIGKVRVGKKTWITPVGYALLISKDAARFRGDQVAAPDTSSPRGAFKGMLARCESKAASTLSWPEVTSDTLRDLLGGKEAVSDGSKSYCGQACVAFVLSLRGATAIDLRDILAKEPKPIISLSRVVALLRSYGWPCKALVLTLDAMQELKGPFLVLTRKGEVSHVSVAQNIGGGKVRSWSPPGALGSLAASRLHARADRSIFVVKTSGDGK